MSANHLLARTAGAVRADLARAVLSAVVRQVALLSIPWFVQHAVDDGIVRSDLPVTLRWAGFVVLAALVQWACVVAWERTANLADVRSGRWLRLQLAERVAGLDRAAVEQYRPGELVVRGGRDVDTVRQWVHGLALWAVAATTAVLVGAGLLSLHPLLLVVAAAMVPALLVVNWWFPRRFSAAAEQVAGLHDDRGDVVDGLVTGALAVRGAGSEQVLLDQHDQVSDRLTVSSVRMAGTSATWAACGAAVPQLAVAAGFTVGAFAVLDGGLTVGALTAFAAWMTTLTLAVRVVIVLLASFSEARVAAGRVADVLALEPQVRDPQQPVPLPLLAPAMTGPGEPLLVARAVTRRAGGRLVVGPVDLELRAGELVALTGATGCGKSSLLRLLARLDDPDDGAVHLLGVDLRYLAVADVRRAVTLVRQRPLLVSGTVAQNLRLGRDLPDKALHAACRAATVHEEVLALDGGYDAAVGEHGATLSGGQLQRLGLARGLLHPAPVLLLDDVTSAVDISTERRVMEALREVAQQRAVLLVAHRASTLGVVDRVVRLEAPSARSAPADVLKATESDTNVRVGAGRG